MQLLATWYNHTAELHNHDRVSREFRHEKDVILATTKFDHWKNALGYSLARELFYTQQYKRNLAAKYLKVWASDFKAIQGTETVAIEHSILHVNKIAYEILKTFQRQAWEFQSQASKAMAANAARERRNIHHVFGLWWEKSLHQRGLQDQVIPRTTRVRKTLIRSYVDVVALDDPPDDRPALEDDFDLGAWIPTLEGHESFTPLPSHLSTPSKRAARARALIEGSTTPAGMPTAVTPLKLRAQAHPATASQLPRGLGFGDSAAGGRKGRFGGEGPSTPGTR